MKADGVRHLVIAKKLVRLLDTQWKIFGIHVGIDPLLDLIPGITSIIPSVLSFYLVYIAIRLEMPRSIIGKMLIHIGIDYLIGIIPIIGFFGDIYFKSNVKNITLIDEFLGHHEDSGVEEGYVL